MILDILNELASDNSRLAKEAIMHREKDNVLFQRVIKATYDPTINYWIKAIPPYSQVAETISLSEALNGLEPIATRKVTGNAAIEQLVVLLSSLDCADAQVLERVIDRDLDCGVQTTTVNKIWKKLIPEFSYMRCSLPTSVDVSKWDWKNGVYSQCLSSAWEIITKDGAVRTIEDIVKNKLKCEVLSYNFAESTITFMPVSGWFDNGATDENWYEIEYEDDCGNIVTTRPLTGEHTVFLSDGSEKTVKNLQKDDIIF